MAKTAKNTEQNEFPPTLFTTLEKEASAEFTEKKSLFIGYATPIKSENDALEFIKKIRHKHGDATHNCFAYTLGGGTVARYSDDGEPQGTAGIPIFDVIKKSGVNDCCVVVTRYFGGILLGAGGLVRAYANGAKIALEAAHIVTYESYTEFRLVCDYSAYQKLEYELPRFGIITDAVDFGQQVTLKLAVKESLFDRFEKRISEMFSMKVTAEILGKRFDFK